MVLIEIKDKVWDTFQNHPEKETPLKTFLDKDELEAGRMIHDQVR